MTPRSRTGTSEAAQATIPHLLPVCCLGVVRSREGALLIICSTMAQQKGLEATLAGVGQGIIDMTDAL